MQHQPPNLLAKIIKEAPTGIAILDRAMRYLAASDRWLTDYRLEGDVVGRCHYDVFPDIPESWKIVHRRALAGESLRSEQESFTRSDGSVQWLKWEVRAWRHDDGDVGGVIILTEDITERVAAEQALKESEARYRLLADHAKDMILQTDLEGNILYASPSIGQLGYTPEDFASRPRGYFTHPDDFAVVIEQLMAAVRGQPVGAFEARMRRADGEWIWTESIPAPVLDNNNRMIGLVSVMRDISERKKAESARRESETKYRILADNSTDMVLTYDQDGRVTYASPSLLLQGHQPADLIGRSFGGLTHHDDQPRVQRMFQCALEGQSAKLEPFRVRAEDGGWTWHEGQLSPLIDETGVQIGVLGASRDVTARMAAEQTLGEVNAELRRVARISTMSAFGASIGHELNQPLTALVANSETALRWMSKNPPNLPMAESAIRRSVDNTLRASETINRLNSMAAKGERQATEFDLNDAIREVFILTASERRRAHIAARQDLSPAPLMIRADRIQVQQVLLNLIGNAIEAMRDGAEAGRRIWIRSRPSDADKVLVEVRDSGPGFDAAIADRIFDHLFTTKTGGTGLGLSISKSIIEAHGGLVWAERATPSGTVFRFQLPRLDGAVAQP